MSFRLISDPEGFHIEQLANIKDKQLETDEQLIILGDLIDSTCIGDINEIGDASTNKKAFNLRNLQWINNKENGNKIETVLVGNRDLNKLKCIPLLNFKNKVKNEDNIDIDWWDNGDDYLAIAEKLINKLKELNGTEWFIDDENFKKYWYPWWNTSVLPQKQEWNPDVDPTNHCLRRFQLIFGMDGKVGTMSAQNLLETIPMELFQTNKIREEEFNKLTPNTKAALVLVVFRRLLLPKDNRKLDFDGLLYDYFNNEKVKVCYHKDFGGKDNDLAIFSHAGMTKTFFETDDLIKKYTDLMSNVDLNPNILPEQQKDVKELVAKLEGGVYKTTNNLINKSVIMERIQVFNYKTKELIKDVLENQMTNNVKPSSNELVLILLGVPDLPHDIRKQNNELNPKSVGPIQPGIINFRKNPDFHFTLDEGDLYQFVGHAPLGYGPTIDLYDNGIENVDDPNYKKHVFVNVDISNSLIGNTFITDTKQDNHCYVQYKKDNNDNKNVIFDQKIAIKDTDKLSGYLNTDNLLVIEQFNAVTNSTVNDLVKDPKYITYSVHGKVNNENFVTDVEGYKVTIIRNPEQSSGKKKFRSMKKRKNNKNKNGKKTKRKLISRKRRYSKKK